MMPSGKRKKIGGGKKKSAELRDRQADCERKKKIRRSKEKPELHS